MRRALLGLGAALLFWACSRHRTPAPAAPSAQLTVAATGDTWGEVEPCG